MDKMDALVWLVINLVCFIHTSCAVHIYRGSDGLSDVEAEMRGMWIATVENIDWPSQPGLLTAQQQAELLDHLDTMADLNMNAVYFQIRPAGDAFYESEIEPWSYWLTGEQGTPPDPFYDPLEFAVTEAHARGIQVHAWFNPYRANLSPDWEGLDPSHIANQLPQYAYPYGTYLWMDPGASEVEDWLVQVIMDIIVRYNIDGVHTDDYYYPYPVEGVDFPDNVTYNDYLSQGGELSRDDWRRSNINNLVERLYETVKDHDKDMLVSYAPFGLYRPGHEDGMPGHICCFDPYEEIYTDTKLWLHEGWMDMFIPQIYWHTDSETTPFIDVLDWWLGENPAERHIYPGLAVYKLVNEDWPVEEIHNQVDVCRERQDQHCLGHLHFSAKYFTDNFKGITDYFQENVYEEYVDIPEMPWLED